MLEIDLGKQFAKDAQISSAKSSFFFNFFKSVISFYLLELDLLELLVFFS